MPRLSSADYEAMADGYEANPLTVEEVLSVDMRMGRPRADTARRGVSPSMSIRFPDQIRNRIKERAVADFDGNEADVVRTAVLQFLADSVETSSAEKRPKKKTARASKRASGKDPARDSEVRGTSSQSAASELRQEVVQKRDDGAWEVRRVGARRATSILSTQAEAIARAREIIARGGGGELHVRDASGRIRAQSTIPPRME